MNLPYPHNPILSADTFVPDAEAHVWEDGRLYLYGSFDQEGAECYCSDRYHVYSTDDLIHWIDHGVSFTVADIGWIEKEAHVPALYAPDCAYRDGTYYLYYCIPDGRCGVATSKSPCGPFVDVGQLIGVQGIDPAVFLDDDGQAYLYWGQFDGVRVAKLKASMVELLPETVTQPLSVAEHAFHEGASVKKIHGKYVFLYTDTHRHADCNNGVGMATCLGYAVSDHPMHGFAYKGIVIDNHGCDPNTWNNHGSLQCFNGQWYVFYHRSTHAGVFSRHVCMEPITVASDGTITEVPMTSSGAGASIPADAGIPAHLACALSGHARIVGDPASRHHLALGGIRPGDTATYRYIALNGEERLSLSVRTDGDCFVTVLIDGTESGLLTAVPSEGYTTYLAMLTPMTGRHTVTFSFDGSFGEASIDEFALLS